MEEIALSANGQVLKLRPESDRWVRLFASVRSGWRSLGAESPGYVISRLTSVLSGKLALNSQEPTWVLSLAEHHYSMYASRLRDGRLRFRWQDPQANWDAEAVFDLKDADVETWLGHLRQLG
jgi:hypothetical protein